MSKSNKKKEVFFFPEGFEVRSKKKKTAKRPLRNSNLKKN